MQSERDDGTSQVAIDDTRIRWYPRTWRERYGPEMIDLLDQEYGSHLPARIRWSLLVGGLAQRARRFDVIGNGVPPKERIRSGALFVLVAWTAFVIAGANFAKFSEHFDQALPHSMQTHQTADVAFTIIQTLAGLATLAVIGGGLIAVPSFFRFVRDGGWKQIRAPFLRAIIATAVTAVVTVVMMLVAHQLPHHQLLRGLHWYGALFLAWGALMALTLVLWAIFAVAAARRVDLAPNVLIAEGILAAFVTAAMCVMVGSIAIWWAAMAANAPAFLNGSPAVVPSSKWDLWWIATVALMLLATCTGVLGVIREAGAWTKLRGNRILD